MEFVPTISEKEYKVCIGLLKLFKIDGKDVSELVTLGEIEIFHAIVFRKWNRVQILCPTQYGKKIADNVPVLTTLGWKKHGELQEGDFVLTIKEIQKR